MEIDPKKCGKMKLVRQENYKVEVCSITGDYCKLSRNSDGEYYTCPLEKED